MLDPQDPLAKLLHTDKRYPLDAYVFMFEALSYAQSVLNLGHEKPSQPNPVAHEDEPASGRHVTGQELCQAIRYYALEQYGRMASWVLRNWGIRATRDFGEIVYNLISVGKMRKTEEDRIEHFDKVYDFDEAFERQFKLDPPHANPS